MWLNHKITDNIPSILIMMGICGIAVLFLYALWLFWWPLSVFVLCVALITVGILLLDDNVTRIIIKGKELKGHIGDNEEFYVRTEKKDEGSHPDVTGYWVKVRIPFDEEELRLGSSYRY